MSVDERLIEWGIGYLESRLPLTQIDAAEIVRNVVSDLMFVGKYGDPVSPRFIKIQSRIKKGAAL